MHNVATARTYNLIEALARECAFSILEKFERVRSVEVKVSKPKAPVKAQFGNISVSYYAERNSVYISLGSSMGDREKTIKAALSKLSAMRGIKLLRTSSMIKTAPVGGVAQNEFVNCAAELDCFLSPRALLDKIHTVEAHLGRVRSRRWDDRPIDIDIIFFGDKVIAEEGLAVPHPHYASRAFVTLPLKELCPEKSARSPTRRSRICKLCRKNTVYAEIFNNYKKVCASCTNFLKYLYKTARLWYNST